MPNADDAVRFERAVLGCLIEDPGLWPDADLTTDDFLISDHQRIWQAFCRLHDERVSIDVVALAAELGDDVAADKLGSLIDGCVAQSFKSHVRRVREASQERRFQRLCERLRLADRSARARILEQLLHSDLTSPDQLIKKFRDIPDIVSMEIQPVEYVVPALGIARNTVVLWTGQYGDGKTILAQAMAVAVARGDEFLGMKCQKGDVLYVDLENPSYVVQARLRAMVGEETAPGLKVWGMWNQQQPPMVGNELLRTMARETRPLVIIDPFRYFHAADENDSTEMAGVMQYLRSLAAVGSAVVLLHHPAKSDGSTGRGSSAIRGACDLAFLHALDKENGLITLKVDKNRNGASHSITVRADFEEGKFDVTEAPWISSRTQKLSKLQQIIAENPGIGTNDLYARVGGKKSLLLRLLEEGRGTLWTTKTGPRRSKLFYPTQSTGSQFPPKGGELWEPVGDARTGSLNAGTGGNCRELREPVEPERLCSVHGFHSQWSKPNGVLVCLVCREGDDHGQKLPLLQT